MSEDLLFQVLTPLNFYVRVTRSYWEYIVTVKHPAMAGREKDVQTVLQTPDEIRVSRNDPNVYLFYKSERVKRWVCAVTKRLDEEGFLITTYPTDAVKEGTKIWPR
jgi:ABC-type ATPase with predicted acetyltransferase domain